MNSSSEPAAERVRTRSEVHTTAGFKNSVELDVVPGLVGWAAVLRVGGRVGWLSLGWIWVVGSEREGSVGRVLVFVYVASGRRASVAGRGSQSSKPCRDTFQGFDSRGGKSIT